MNDTSINKLQTFFDKWQGKDSNGATVIYLDASDTNEDSFILGNLGIRKSDPSYAIDVSGYINADGIMVSGTRRDEQWNEAYNLSQAFKETNEPTGFTSPELVTVTYNPTARTVTLSGTVEAYYHGELVPMLSAGYVSPPHDVSPTTTLFLKYNSNGIEWQTTTWNFNEIQIAYICYKADGTFCFGQRETHGLMQWQTHKELHETIGTYRKSGGDISNITIGNTTLKQPYISETIICDEDLKSTLSALTSATYSQLFLSGATTVNIISGTQIVPVSTNRPYYNSWTGSAFTQTLMGNNNYMSIWIAAIPTTNDAISLSKRFLFLQGQTQGTLASQQALNPQDLTLGDFSSLSPEFVFIEQIIIQYTSANWSIAEIRRLTGNKYLQTGSPSGIFLSQVSRLNDTLLGAGTSVSPLYVNPDLSITNLSGTNLITNKIKPFVDSISGIQISNSAGVSFINFDTLNKRLGVNYNTPTSTLSVSGNFLTTSEGVVGTYIGFGGAVKKIDGATSSLLFYTASTLQATLTSGGNLALGVADPYVKLHVDGSIFVKTGDKIGSSWDASTTSIRNNILFYGTDGDMVFTTFYPNTSSFRFFTGGRSAPGELNELLTLYKTNKVGINVPIPASTLHLSGTSDIIRLQSTATNGSPNISFYNSTIKKGYIGYGSGTTDDTFAISQDLAASLIFKTNATTKMTILSGGNIGMDVLVPSSKLDVGGDIEISGTGSVYFGDPTTDGSGRLRYNNATQVFYFEKRSGGSWVVA